MYNNHIEIYISTSSILGGDFIWLIYFNINNAITIQNIFYYQISERRKIMKKNIKIFISISLAVIITTMTIFPAFSVSTNNSKLSDKLISAINNASDTDVIPIYVFLKESDQDKVKEIMREEYSQDVEIYENEERFYSEIAPNLKVGNKKISEITNSTKITAETFNFNSKNTLNLDTKKEINKAVQNELNNYLKNKRNSVSLVVDDYLTTFCESANIENNDIIFKSKYLDFLIINASKSNIIKLSNNTKVDYLDLYEKLDKAEEQWNAASVISADSSTGTGSSSFNNGTGYDGTGVTIGIIEFGRYDSNNYNLQLVHGNNLNHIKTNNISGTVGSHATTVTSIICGRKTTINGKTYEGLATGATVWQTTINDDYDLFTAIELLASKGANVINFSGAFFTGSVYHNVDKVVDEHIERLRVAFVKSSGNERGNVTSPGKGYNVITVGNLRTKINDDSEENIFNTALSAPYTMAGDSQYGHASYLTNKPDVVAPGCNIYLPTSATNAVSKGGGTSYAAPLVTGMAAQLMQENPMYKVNPNALKNIIVCGASNADITGTTTSYGQLENESGAGLVNAINSLNAMDNVYYEAYTASSTTGVYDTIADVYIKKGQTIRIALTFEKEEYIDLTTYYGNNIDIRLAQTAGYAVHAKSESLKDNVEIIEFKATSSGTYNIQTRLTSSILTTSGNNDLHYWVSWYIY